MMRGSQIRWLFVSGLVMGIFANISPAWCQRLIWLGRIDDKPTFAFDVSADGSVVVGGWEFLPDVTRAFRWTCATGIQDLPTLRSEFGAGPFAEAYGVSADGSIVVGWSNYVVGCREDNQVRICVFEARASRWTGASRAELITEITGRETSVAMDISADGSVIVGAVRPFRSRGYIAFRWTANEGRRLLLSVGNTTWATAVSADGSVVVGYGITNSGIYYAFRWTEQTGMQDLGTLGGSTSNAYGVSADGSTVVGYARTELGEKHAFRWTEQTGMQDLGTLGGTESIAHASSADGTVIVGRARDESGRWRAFRWTEQTGMQDLNLLFSNLLMDGSFLLVARSITPDARYIVGDGRRPDGKVEAFLLDTHVEGDVNSDNCVNDTDLWAVLFAFGSSSAGREDVNCDGLVDDADLMTVLFNFGSGC